MNSSSPVLDPSLYGFGGQKRSLDNGGQPSARTHHANITVEQLLQVADFNLYWCFLTKVLALNSSIIFSLKSLTQIQGKVSTNVLIEQLVRNGVATNTFPFEAEVAAAVVEKTSWLLFSLVELSRVVLLNHHMEEPSLHSDNASGQPRRGLCLLRLLK